MGRGPRRDEEWARNVFDQWLTATGVTGHTWNPGTDPPDFSLRLADGTAFAVEVTQVQEELALGQGTMSEQDVTVCLTKAIRELERKALVNGVLSGFYAVHAEPIPHLKKELPQIEARLTEYLLATSKLAAAPEAIIREGPWGRQWTICKLAREGAEIAESIALHGMALWQGEYIEKLHDRVEAILSRKREQLRGIDGPKVLLLLDRFHYADNREWATMATRLDLAAFHTVARVHGDRQCQVLSQTDFIRL